MESRKPEAKKLTPVQLSKTLTTASNLNPATETLSVFFGDRKQNNEADVSGQRVTERTMHGTVAMPYTYAGQSHIHT